MTPAEKVVAEAILRHREDQAMGLTHRALKPAVQERTGVSDATYWRTLRIVNGQSPDTPA